MSIPFFCVLFGIACVAYGAAEDPLSGERTFLSFLLALAAISGLCLMLIAFASFVLGVNPVEVFLGP